MTTAVRVAFLTGSDADWGGASRVLYTALRALDRSRIEPLVMLSGEGPVKAELEARGIRCFAWGMPTEPANRLRYVAAVSRAARFFRRERPALLHVNLRFWRPAEVLAARLLRIPALLHLHVVNPSADSSFGWYAAALCVSRFVARASRPASLPKEVVYNPVDPVRFARGVDRRTEWGIPRDAVAVAFVGQIRDIKGVADFLALASLLKDDGIRFLIAGECRDPLRYPGSYTVEDLHSMAGGDCRIRYLGYVRSVEDVYRSADIVVVPSRHDEPLGLINLEAAIAGRPVVAYRVGGIPEVVEDGVTGHLVEMGDVRTLAEKVGALVRDPETRKRLGEAARRKVATEFTRAPVRRFEEVLLRYARR